MLKLPLQLVMLISERRKGAYEEYYLFVIGAVMKAGGMALQNLRLLK